MKKKSECAEQYKNPRWQKLRLKILERDDWVCQKCYDDEAELQVHHRRYIHGNKIWEYPLEDLVTLCKECHEEEKDLMKEYIDQFVEIIKRTLFSTHVNDLVCSLGYILHQDLYHPDILISALSWVVENKLEENIINPHKDYCCENAKRLRREVL